MSAPFDWTVSIISHGHGDKVLATLESLAAQMGPRPYRVVLTLNQPECIDYLRRAPASLRRRLTVLHVSAQRSFAENHNRALLAARTRGVLALDPELTFIDDVLPEIEQILAEPHWAMAAPRAYTRSGAMEDNARRMVTPQTLLRRYLAAQRMTDYCAPSRQGPIPVDWLAGLFMAMRSDVFRSVNGFDKRYRLYCEDVDLCLRIRAAGYHLALLPELRVTHPAGRRTLRHPQHLAWHSMSMLRLWTSPAYRQRRQYPSDAG